MNMVLFNLFSRAPAVVRRAALVQLFRATASAFDAGVPRLRGLSNEGCLLEYARFTSMHAEAALSSGVAVAALRERLYGNAYRLGWLTGRVLGIRTLSEVMAAGRLLYGTLDIDFAGHGAGEITIGRCYFADFYSPDVCRLMSAMDLGLMAGLAGGGELVFVERITEGRPCCRAYFTPAASGRPNPANPAKPV